MAATVYPSTLPGPTDAPLTPAERRLLSELDGARIADVRQRDRLSIQSVVFVFSFAEMAIFNAWWKDDLVYGGGWFASEWPITQGGTGVRRFAGTPARQLIAGYGWRVSATCEVRGVGELPTVCFDELFADLGEYSTITGNRGLFTLVSTPYGTGMNVAAQNAGTEARIRKSFPDHTAERVSLKFQITASNSDDAGRLALFDASTSKILLIARRETVFDSNRRAYVFLGGAAFIVSAAALGVGVWYSLDLSIASGAGNTSCTLTKLSDGSTETTVFAGSFNPPPVNRLDFSADSGGLTTPIIFTDLHVCPT